MNWYYESAGQQQGPVSETDLERLLTEGKITLDTLVWREGMAGWAPFRVARASSGPEAVSIGPGAGGQDIGLEVTRPAQSSAASQPSPTAGSDIPQPGWIRCSLTGRYFPPSEIIYLEGKPYSAAAKPQVVASLQSGNVLPTNAGDRNGPPWEHRATLGMWKALVDTVKFVLMEPARCFATMRRDGGMGGPLVFWMLTAGVGVAINQIYGLLLQGAMAGFMSASGMPANQAGAMFGMQATIGAFGIVLAPIFGLIGVFIWAGLIHLTLMMLKSANQPFETTLRVACYALGATGVMNLVPMCGGLIALVWSLVAMCIGLAPAQDTTVGKGVAAVLIPLGVCCLGGIALYGVIIAGVIAATGAASN
jgi:hypothetical protein